MIIRTPHSVIFRGVATYGMEVFSVSQQGEITSPGTVEEDARQFVIDTVMSHRPGLDRTRIRVVELSWTDVTPVLVPQVQPVGTETEENDQ